MPIRPPGYIGDRPGADSGIPRVRGQQSHPLIVGARDAPQNGAGARPGAGGNPTPAAGAGDSAQVIEHEVAFALAALGVVVLGSLVARRLGVPVPGVPVPGVLRRRQSGQLRDADLRTLQRELDHEERLLSRDRSS
jgi:hypothetical protein